MPKLPRELWTTWKRIQNGSSLIQIRGIQPRCRTCRRKCYVLDGPRSYFYCSEWEPRDLTKGPR
jgi:hypothetical protein